MSAIFKGSPVSFREFHCDKRVLGVADLYALSKIKELLLIETLCLSYQESPLLRGLLLSRSSSFNNIDRCQNYY